MRAGRRGAAAAAAPGGGTGLQGRHTGGQAREAKRGLRNCCAVPVPASSTAVVCAVLQKKGKRAKGRQVYVGG